MRGLSQYKRLSCSQIINMRRAMAFAKSLGFVKSKFLFIGILTSGGLKKGYRL